MTLGEQTRDFTPVDEVARQLSKALDFSSVCEGVLLVKHVGTGKAKTLREFAEYWWKEWGGTGKLLFGAQPYRKNEVMRFVPEI